MSEVVQTEAPSVIRSGDTYFLTPPPTNDIRVQLTRGEDYVPTVESTAKGRLAFNC